MKTNVLFPAICAAILGSYAMADGDTKVDISSWDADGDKMVTQEEWADAIDEQDLFDRVDKNNNGNFDVEEALDGVLDYDLAMDIDDGGTISRDEFIVGLHSHYDENGDQQLDETEFDVFASNDQSPLLMTDESAASSLD